MKILVFALPSLKNTLIKSFGTARCAIVTLTKRKMSKVAETLNVPKTALNFVCSRPLKSTTIGNLKPVSTPA